MSTQPLDESQEAHFRSRPRGLPDPEESPEERSGIRYSLMRVRAPGTRRRDPNRPRAVTLSPKRVSAEERQALERGRALYPDEPVERPRTRGECVGGPRPCPWISCSHHLYLDVNEDSGGLKINHPGLEPWELPETCALDVADRGGITLEEVGALASCTRERIRQIEARALARLARLPEVIGLVDAYDAASAPGPRPRAVAVLAVPPWPPLGRCDAEEL